jgi:hypothetical protein
MGHRFTLHASRQFANHPTQHLNEMVYLPLLNDERGGERDDVARHPDEQPFVEAANQCIQPSRSWLALARLQFDARDQTDVPDVDDVWKPAQRVQRPRYGDSAARSNSPSSL